MYKSTNNRVTFTFDDDSLVNEAIDIYVEPGINTVKIPCNLRVPRKTEPFPDVQKLIIGKGVKNIEILNTLFPNVKEVESWSDKFETETPYLIASDGGRSNYKILKNTFCSKERIADLEGIGAIDGYAFYKSNFEHVINAKDVIFCHKDAFKDSYIGNKPFENGVKMAGSIVIDIDENADEVVIQDDAIPVSAYAENVDLSKVKKLVVHDKESMIFYKINSVPQEICFDSTSKYKSLAGNLIYLAHLRRSDGTFVKKFSITDRVPGYKYVDGVVYSDDMKILVAASIGIESFEVPDGVERIYRSAFEFGNIKTIKFSDSVKIIDENAFSSCRYLEHIEFGKGLQEIKSQAFNACRNLKSTTFPDSLKRIEKYAFYSTCLDSITLNEGLTFIGGMSFVSALSSVKDIAFPKSMEFVDGMSFEDTLITVTAEKYFKNFEQSFVSFSRFDSRPELPSTVTAKCGNKTACIPRCIKPSCYKEYIERASCFFQSPDDEKCEFWDFAGSAAGREDAAFEEYQYSGSVQAKDYVKKNSKRMICRMIDSGYKEEMIVEFLKTGFVSKVTMKKLVSKTEDCGMTVVKSYILNLLGEKKESEKFYL